MAQARGRASRAAEPSAVHETLGLKVRCGPCLHRSPANCPGSWSPAACSLSLCLSTFCPPPSFTWPFFISVTFSMHPVQSVHSLHRFVSCGNAFNFMSFSHVSHSYFLCVRLIVWETFSYTSLSFLCFCICAKCHILHESGIIQWKWLFTIQLTFARDTFN